MCSAADDPTQYDIPEPQPPRVYRLAGDAPEEPRGSVALAVLGTMIDEAEAEVDDSVAGYLTQQWVVPVLRKARDRVAAAEARL